MQQFSYRDRDKILAALGFPNYYTYLKSPEWQKIRSKTMSRDKGICRGCGGFASKVHHVRYEKEDLEGPTKWLVAVCHTCHEKVEFDERGKKRTLFDVQRISTKIFSGFEPILNKKERRYRKIWMGRQGSA